MPPETIALINMIANVVMACATVALVILARNGLNRWRAELTGKAQFDLAQHIQRLALRFQEEFTAARSTGTNLLYKYDIGSLAKHRGQLHNTLKELQSTCYEAR